MGRARRPSSIKDLAKALDIPEDYAQEEARRQLEEIERRRKSYCAGRPPLDVTGRTAIIVDDAIATGATMRVALRAVRRRNPARKSCRREARSN